MFNEVEFKSKSPIKLSHEDAGRPWDGDASQLKRLGKRPALKVCTWDFVFSLLDWSVRVMSSTLLRVLEKKKGFLWFKFPSPLTILSVTSDSCPYWVSVAQYSLPGRVLSCEFASTPRITEHSWLVSRTFQLLYAKYAKLRLDEAESIVL